jgi:uncharacterized membrane protein YdjX (TVP38/TMEM64 family)
VAAVAAVVAAVVTVVPATPLGRYLDYDEFQSLLRSAGLWAPVLYVVVYAFGPVFLMPATVMTFAGAAMFGMGWGMVLITLGANLGAISAFSVGRWAARDFVTSRMGRDNGLLANLSAALSRNGLWAIFLMRLFLAPYNILNYVAALTPIRFRDFALGTLLGMLPVTFAVVYTGDLLRRAWRSEDLSALWSPRTLVALMVLLSCMVLPVLVRRWWRGRLEAR